MVANALHLKVADQPEEVGKLLLLLRQAEGRFDVGAVGRLLAAEPKACLLLLGVLFVARSWRACTMTRPTRVMPVKVVGSRLLLCFDVMNMLMLVLPGKQDDGLCAVLQTRTAGRMRQRMKSEEEDGEQCRTTARGPK